MIFESIASFTKPATTGTPYTSGDLVANHATAGSVVPMPFYFPSRGILIWKAKIMTSSATPTNSNYRLHLFKDSPTVTNGDNGVLAHTESNYQGFIGVDLTGSLGSDDNGGVGIFVNTALAAPLAILLDPDRMLYGLLEVRAALVEVSAEVWTVTLVGETR